jgi:hypothetical protein
MQVLHGWYHPWNDLMDSDSRVKLNSVLRGLVSSLEIFHG